MSKTKVVLKNIGLGMLYKPISVIISFIVVPITISYLGDVNYGLWATILSIISWISFFDIGIGNGLRNHLANALAIQNFKSARKYIATSYAVITGISVLLLAIIGIFCYLLNWQELLNVTNYSNNQLSLILIVNFVFICISFVLNLVSTIYYAMQRASIIGLMQILNQLLNFIGIYYLSSINYSKSLLGISLVYGIASVIVNVIFSGILFIGNKELLPRVTDFDVSKVKSLTNLGVKFFIIQIAAMIIFTTDNLIITRLFGPEEVTPYNITYKVFSVIIMFHTIVITPIWSAVTKAYAERDINWIKRVIKKQNVFQVFVFILSVSLVIFFRLITEIWLGREVQGLTYLLIINFGIYTVLSTWCNNYAYILNGIGAISLQLKIAVIQGVVNIPLSILFAKNLNMGISGVIMGTNATLLIAAIIYPVHLKKLLNSINSEFN